MFVVFISLRAIESQYVRNEISYALKRRKALLAIHVEETTLPGGLELPMGHIQAVLKFALPDELYQDKLERALPKGTIQFPQRVEPKPSAIKFFEPQGQVLRQDVGIEKKGEEQRQRVEEGDEEKKEIFMKILFLINSPARQLTSVFSAIPRRIVALTAYRRQKR